MVEDVQGTFTAGQMVSMLMMSGGVACGFRAMGSDNIKGAVVAIAVGLTGLFMFKAEETVPAHNVTSRMSADERIMPMAPDITP